MKDQTGVFKIDLIVWKLSWIVPINSPLLWFKIDLIVWKWSSEQQLTENISGLK